MVSVAFHSALRNLVQRVASQVDKLTGGKLRLGSPMAENKRSKMMQVGYFFGIRLFTPGQFCPTRENSWPRLLMELVIYTVLDTYLA